MKSISLAPFLFFYCITSAVAYFTPVDGDDTIKQIYSILQRHGVGPNSYGDITKEMGLPGIAEGGLALLAATLPSYREAELQEKTLVSKFLTHLILSYEQENVHQAIIKSSEDQHIPTIEVPQVESKLVSHIRMQSKNEKLVQKTFRCMQFIFQSFDNFGESDS